MPDSASNDKADLSVAIDAAHSSVAPDGMSTRVIAVDGPGGAGKSTFAAQLALGLGNVQIVHTDDFASWDNPIDWWPKLRESVLVPLAAGDSAVYVPTSWEDEVKSQVVVQPAQFVVLEGVSASRQAFQPYLAYSIWIETPRDVRLRRGLERDGLEARERWEEWMADEDLYIARENPADRADLIVPGS
ncbi:MAG: hypothetical protein HOM68_14225 [Gemmatimonadetes bacterium]|nr:hypothetical protein [Gemmatimonadota bacterium]MBT5057696.1 hypothetical protein [Gemmatimonadota bacterium]MBT5141392.1 hypothetical protein [Gemmatimonadota bacterium]MBT5590473.1 hypothetical protein [Gemmatimonadota bacterium]MBT5964310.1 hypothetical protein [Gemmatimonadota bacterium]